MIIHHIIIVVTDSMYTSCLVHVSQATKGASVSLPVQHQRHFSTWTQWLRTNPSDYFRVTRGCIRQRIEEWGHKRDIAQIAFTHLKDLLRQSQESQRDMILKQLTILTDIQAHMHGELWRSSFEMPYPNSYSLSKFSHIGFELHWKPWKSLHRRRRPVMFCCVKTTSRTIGCCTVFKL